MQGGKSSSPQTREDLLQSLLGRPLHQVKFVPRGPVAGFVDDVARTGDSVNTAVPDVTSLFAWEAKDIKECIE